MRNHLRALPVSVGLIALVAIVAIGAPQDGPSEAALTSQTTSDPGVTTPETPRSIVAECYRGPLPYGVQPSVHMPHFDRVVVVTARQAESVLGPDLPFGGIPQIHTTVIVTFDEWIKGDGPDEGMVSFWGGTVGNLSMSTTSCNDSLAPGEHAVVFLNENAVLPGVGSIDVAYVMKDGVATSVIDQRALPADELLEMLRGAADDPAPTPLPYPDFLPPVTQVSQSAVIAQVAITSTEDTDAGTVIRASVSEPIKGDIGKTVEFTKLRAYGGGEVPADARPGAGDETVVFLRDDGTLFDWYLYRDNGVASSWVDEVSMPVERLIDVLRDKVALN